MSEYYNPQRSCKIYTPVPTEPYIQWLKKKLQTIGAAFIYDEIVGSYINFQKYFHQIPNYIKWVVDVAPGSFSPVLLALGSTVTRTTYVAIDIDSFALNNLQKQSRYCKMPALFYQQDAVKFLARPRVNQLICLRHSIDDIFIAGQIAQKGISWGSWDEALNQYCNLKSLSRKSVYYFVDTIINFLKLNATLVIIEHFVRPIEAPAILQDLDHLICARLRQICQSKELRQIISWEENHINNIAFEACF